MKFILLLSNMEYRILIIIFMFGSDLAPDDIIEYDTCLDEISAIAEKVVVDCF